VKRLRDAGEALSWHKPASSGHANRAIGFSRLSTGAANEQALGFYRHMGYLDEDVTLVKLL
jgi:hypothetical protein